MKYTSHPATVSAHPRGALPPDFRTLGSFHPKGMPNCRIPVRIRLDEPGLSLYYDRNGDLANISDPAARLKVEETLALLEEQDIHQALATHRKVGVIRITDYQMLATVICRGRMIDLEKCGITMPFTVKEKAFRKLEEMEYPTQAITLGESQIT